MALGVRAKLCVHTPIICPAGILHNAFVSPTNLDVVEKLVPKISDVIEIVLYAIVEVFIILVAISLWRWFYNLSTQNYSTLTITSSSIII